MNIQILTNKGSWIDFGYKIKTINTLKPFSKKILFIYNHKKLRDEFDINQSIKKQFNLMRVNDNNNYPSFLII